MTREEELDWLCRLRSNIYVYMPKEWLIPMNNALDMAIKDLEQEPFINKPCVSGGVCEHDKNKVLDKIRAEIDKIYKREGNSVDCLNALDELKCFIDKYNAESDG